MGSNVNGLFLHGMANVTHFFDLHGSNELSIAMIHTHVDDSIRKESFIPLKFCMTAQISLRDEHHVEVHRTEEVEESKHRLAHGRVDGGKGIDGPELIKNERRETIAVCLLEVFNHFSCELEIIHVLVFSTKFCEIRHLQVHWKLKTET